MRLTVGVWQWVISRHVAMMAIGPLVPVSRQSNLRVACRLRDNYFLLTVVIAVKTTGILCERAPPRNGQYEKYGVEPRMVETSPC